MTFPYWHVTMSAWTDVGAKISLDDVNVHTYCDVASVNFMTTYMMP